ncbi:MAG: oxidoreductase [Candidatus Hydrogenedentota bacterium]|nr:MAG: oxidoreductase [Candidatus Hydrogenedentota bacterium]
MISGSTTPNLLKVAIIGGYGHFECAFEDSRHREVFHICGIAPGRVGEPIENVVDLARQSGLCPEIYSTPMDLFNEIQPDVALVTCRFSDHAQIIGEALARGIHVLSEKPLATNWEDFQQLQHAYAQGNSQLSALFTMRYIPEMYTLANFVLSGGIGDVYSVQAQKSYKLGTRPTFFQERTSHGGLIPWVGSHTIDLICWLSNREVTHVRAWHSKAGAKKTGDLEMLAHIHCSLEGDCFGSAHLDYMRPEQAATHGDDRVRVLGADGIAEVQGGIARVIRNGNEEILSGSDAPNILMDFIDQIKGKGACRVSADDAFRATRICLTARDSADLGKEIEL